MAYKLLVTEAAHEDLDEALGYIALQLSNPAAAANLLGQVEQCYEQLKQFPFLYEKCRDPRLFRSGYHKVSIGNYIMIYHPLEETRTVYILRFLYGGRDYENMI